MSAPFTPAPQPLAEPAVSGFRCRRYLFDRADGFDPRPTAVEAPPARSEPEPPAAWWDGAPERRP